MHVAITAECVGVIADVSDTTAIPTRDAADIVWGIIKNTLSDSD